MNGSDHCIPWYFPINDTSMLRICDPWEAREFRHYMNTIPVDACNSCLPDCNTTVYTASVTAAPFRRCDNKNLGISFLCNFLGKQIQPPIWGQNVLNQYMDEINQIPDYMQFLVNRSNERTFSDEKASGKEIFMAANTAVNEFGEKISKRYDAFEKDIAMVTFFFEANSFSIVIST